jgi:hypothetical protein
MSFLRLMSILAAVLPGLLVAGPAVAGRPLGTDDAATAGARSCQVEVWFERARNQHAWAMSPVCGIGDSVEVGLDLRRPSPAAIAGERHSADMMLKWVDPAWKVGEARFGLKVYGGSARRSEGGWAPTGRGLLGLVSVELVEGVDWHVNLGDEYDHEARRHRAVAQTALTCQPAEAWQLFGEVQGLRGAGAAQQTVGARHWVVKDVLGLDLTAGRTAGQPGSTVWTLGFGWYGIGY